MKKGLLIGGGAVVVLIILIAVGVGFLISNLDSLVEAAIEEFGSEITQVSVELDKAEISPTSGAGALHGLDVGNPSGFKTDQAFRLGMVSVKVDTGTLTQDPVVIKEIVVDGPEVTYETGDGGSNIDAIQKNVDSYMKRFGGSDGGDSKSGEGPKLVIDHLYVRNGKVNVSAAFLEGKALGADLPEIHLTDIGKDKKGATPGEVVKKIMDSLTGGIGTAVGSLNLDDLMKGATEGLKEGAGAVTETLEKTGGDAAGGAVKEGVEGAGKAVKKLFGD